MFFQETPLYEEIGKILSSTQDRPFYDWHCYFRIRQPNPIQIEKKLLSAYSDEEHEGRFRPFKITNIDFERDYEQSSSDEGSIKVVFPLGMWYKVLQPCRDHLECVLTRSPRGEDQSDDFYREKETDVYQAIPKIDAEAVADGSDTDRIGRNDMDQLGVIDIEFQLTDLSVEKLRTVTVGGNFRKVRGEDVIKGLIRQESAMIQIMDQGPAINHVKFFPSDNPEVREHIIIPQATPLFDVPGYIQRHCGGIYTHGINHYIQNNDWYIFPPYHTRRGSIDDRTLTVLKIPERTYDYAERTYRLEGDKLIIMASSDSAFDDKGDEQHIVDGNGIRFADARQFMHGLIKTKDNKAFASRGRLNHEYISKELLVREEPQNNVKLSGDTIHANPFYEDSKLASKEGSFYSFLWRNSDASYLYPGMPVRIQYLKGDEIRELSGTLLKVHHSIQMLGQGITSMNYQQQTALFIYAVRETSLFESGSDLLWDF